MLMSDNIQIRSANLEADVDQIQRLAVQLGYDRSREDICRSLDSMLNHPDYEFVVVTANQTVVGWMSLNVRLRAVDAPFLQVTAIVTDESVRGQGFGKRLLAYAEAQAKSKRLAMVGIFTNKKRTDAHTFYKNRGYTAAKESYFFTKDLKLNAEH
jgi:N-acetylglutamate synthase-like GNAT family acetyltransferase